MDLSPYIQVYGNCFGPRKYFIAVHFKKPVIQCSTKNPIEIPKKSILVGHKITAEDCLIFVYPPDETLGIPVPDKNIRTLLLALFKPNTLLHSTYASETLFVVTTRNPFKSIWITCKKNTAFRALRKMFIQSDMTLEDFTELRHFNRNSFNWRKFNAWFHLAESLIEFAFKKKFLKCKPSAQLGKRIRSILKRSKKVDQPLLPADFYECQIMLTDTDPVGILCRLQSNHEVEYISPMVVSELTQYWDRTDINGEKCNHWFPLYKNAETWKTYGVHFYCERLYDCLIQVRNILKWLQSKHIDKYRLLYADLNHVANILLGE